MDSIVGPQPMRLGEAGPLPNEGVRDTHDKVSRPIGIEIANNPPVVSDRDSPLMATSYEGGSGLDIGDGRRGDQSGLINCPPDKGRSLFFHIELHKGAGIKVQSHRRSSMTAWATVGPLIRGGRRAPRGFPPSQWATPSRSMASAR